MDIPTLARIQVAACLSDNCFKLYFTNPAEFTTWIVDMLTDQIGAGDWEHVKAVDSATGRIGAWASWKIPADEEIRRADTDAATEPGPGPGPGPESNDNDGPQEPAKNKKIIFPPGIATHIHAATSAWLHRITRGRRHMVCKALFTDPIFQRQGMGNALVAHGAQLADSRGLPTFLQASAYGFPVYAAHGFETMECLDVDLREWAPGAKGGDRGYGNYRFRFMVRLPRTFWG